MSERTIAESPGVKLGDELGLTSAAVSARPFPVSVPSLGTVHAIDGHVVEIRRRCVALSRAEDAAVERAEVDHTQRNLDMRCTAEIEQAADLIGLCEPLLLVAVVEEVAVLPRRRTPVDDGARLPCVIDQRVRRQIAIHIVTKIDLGTGA